MIIKTLFILCLFLSLLFSGCNSNPQDQGEDVGDLLIGDERAEASLSKQVLLKVSLSDCNAIIKQAMADQEFLHALGIIYVQNKLFESEMDDNDISINAFTEIYLLLILGHDLKAIEAANNLAEKYIYFTSLAFIVNFKLGRYEDALDHADLFLKFTEKHLPSKIMHASFYRCLANLAAGNQAASQIDFTSVKRCIENSEDAVLKENWAGCLLALDVMYSNPDKEYCIEVVNEPLLPPKKSSNDSGIEFDVYFYYNLIEANQGRKVIYTGIVN